MIDRRGKYNPITVVFIAAFRAGKRKEQRVSGLSATYVGQSERCCMYILAE